jgi:hypothetical protein
VLEETPMFLWQKEFHNEFRDFAELVISLLRANTEIMGHYQVYKTDMERFEGFSKVCGLNEPTILVSSFPKKWQLQYRKDTTAFLR